MIGPRRRLVVGVAAAALALSGCLEPSPAFDEDVERIPVANEEGEQVGTVPAEAVDEVAENGGRAKVLDDQGRQVGWWTQSGFVPLDG